VSIIPGLLAVFAIPYAICRTRAAEDRECRPIRVRVRPVLQGQLGRLMVSVGAFELGNVAATVLILRATNLLTPGRGQDDAAQIAIALYVVYNLTATRWRASLPAGWEIGADRSRCWPEGWLPSRWPMPASPPRAPACHCWPRASPSPESASAASRRPSTQPSPHWHRRTCVARRSACSPPFRAFGNVIASGTAGLLYTVASPGAAFAFAAALMAVALATMVRPLSTA